MWYAERRTMLGRYWMRPGMFTTTAGTERRFLETERQFQSVQAHGGSSISF